MVFIARKHIASPVSLRSSIGDLYNKIGRGILLNSDRQMAHLDGEGPSPLVLAAPDRGRVNHLIGKENVFKLRIFGCHNEISAPLTRAGNEREPLFSARSKLYHDRRGSGSEASRRNHRRRKASRCHSVILEGCLDGLAISYLLAHDDPLKKSHEQVRW